MMFRERQRSYRELPIRYADFGVLHRNELSGLPAAAAGGCVSGGGSGGGGGGSGGGGGRQLYWQTVVLE